MKKIAIALMTSVALAGAGYAKPAAHHPVKPSVHAKKTAALVCPVTGNKIASIKQAVGKSTYKGKTYYFCCPDCKPRFEWNPAKYVKNSAKGIYEKM